MARFYDSTYDPQKDSGTSGVEVSDLNPEDQRDVDLRRLDPEERDIYTDKKKEFSHSDKQEPSQKQIGKFMKAAKAAGKYKQSQGIAEPTIRGKTPVGKGNLNGVEIPSLRGRNYGSPGAGATEYAHKPKPNSGRPFDFMDSFN